MAQSPSDNNFLFAIFKFILFLVLCFFVAGLSYQFVLSVHASADVDILLLPGTIFFTLCYYLFIKDLNDAYSKIQTFFFRNPLVSYLIPFLLIAAAVICLVMVKLFGLAINRGIFIFIGGFILASQMIYISVGT